LKASLIKKLKEKGLKLTSQRLAIIEILIDKTPAHPGANLIYQEAKKRERRISLSTVYSTLNELSRHGIIKTLEFDRMENRYEANMTEHINLVCKGCKKIMDYKLPVMIDKDAIEKRSRFRVTDGRFEYYGYCQECKKNLPS
jgi:Fe2+ or Zn2+ uptake regulation protein